MATRGAVPGCAFIATLTELGTPVPGDVTHAAADTLINAIDLSVFTIGLPELGLLLSQLGDPRGINVLVNIARDTEILPYVRVQAASCLAGRGDRLGAKLLGAIAHDTSIFSSSR